MSLPVEKAWDTAADLVDMPPSLYDQLTTSVWEGFRDCNRLDLFDRLVTSFREEAVRRGRTSKCRHDVNAETFRKRGE